MYTLVWNVCEGRTKFCSLHCSQCPEECLMHNTHSINLYELGRSELINKMIGNITRFLKERRGEEERMNKRENAELYFRAHSHFTLA